MKEVLRRLDMSSRHFGFLDQFLLDNDDEYRRMEERLNQLSGDYTNFCRELYFGGSKSRGNPPKGSRQMILSDIFQYIITSRGYYLAARGEEQRRKFVEIVMYLVNQWLIMDCFGPRDAVNLRRDLMQTLRDKIGTDFFEEGSSYHVNRFDSAFDYNDDLIPDPPNPNSPSSDILGSYDSLFPKIRGGPIEVLVYLYLLQRRLGFVTSLLTQQRLIKKNRVVAPPDILLLRSKGEIVGLEIGRGKEKQSADFSLITGIPTFSIDLVDRQPFRCDSCGRWIVFCRRVIKSYSESGVPSDHDHKINCSSCGHFNDGGCPDIMCYTTKSNRYNKTRKARHHFRCLDAETKQAVMSEDLESLVAYFPLVEGLEDFQEE